LVGLSIAGLVARLAVLGGAGLVVNDEPRETRDEGVQARGLGDYFGRSAKTVFYGVL